MENIFGSYMMTRDMEDAQGSCIHEEEVRGIHVSIGNAKTKSSGHTSGVEPMELIETMRILHKEVKMYIEYNERMIRSQEEILESLNMLQIQVNEDFGTKQATNVRQVADSRSHDKRNDHGGY
jgi:hypothetical protein